MAERRRLPPQTKAGLGTQRIIAFGFALVLLLMLSLTLLGLDHLGQMKRRITDLATQEAFVRAIAARLDKEGVAHDIAFHRDAPPHFRIWAGATIEEADMKALMPWLAYAFETQKAALNKAAA